MENVYKRLIALVILAAGVALLGTGCGTTKGFGEDVEDLGEAIQNE